MTMLFYISGAIAIITTLMMVANLNAVHALLYLIVSLLAVSIVFYVLGAPFVAALEVIIYAGAIMVLFIFVIMMLNPGMNGAEAEKSLLKAKSWTGPAILSAALLGEYGYLFFHHSGRNDGAITVDPGQVSIILFGPYLIGVEVASLLLMGALISAYHLTRRRR